ncbi:MULTISPECIES: hypothetical protein [Pseudomonas]|uniref:hypothetical protein n=1 Tax=Pseudomonas TaxID=286 RepID=UPI000C06B465|nr:MULTISPECIES: hypothetical protein [Pseudomonas]MBP0943340.1 hypothetical protein [Pseudomonas alliivorans]MEE4633401.1 hypothetical protein [Pseudomonas alliivorans]MEE4652600.1 hypothetical protein [Pseudomonas alliivorans]MEE4733885.1 hypothetical protein [Pseudomonas alliivorans]MEE4748392.1 hypothetical protein [Pseudomonas alliivorans]
MKFRHLVVVSALVFWALAVAWMLMPAQMLANWGVGFSSEAGLVSRRAAALYLGVGVMLFLARDAGPSVARSALVAGFVTACLTLAALGIFELLSGHANPGILAAVAIEVLFSLAFLFVQHRERHLVQ